MNSIAHDQNLPEPQRLLKARQRIYSDATRYQLLQLLFTVVVPAIGAVLALVHPPTRPYVATYGLIATALDAMWLDRAQRRLLKVAARITEQFDCIVLKLKWNAFVAGKPEDEEVVDAAARRWKDDSSSIRDWYVGIDPEAPHATARMVCQRMNLQYDASLRRNYGVFLICCAGATVAALVAGAVFLDMRMLDFVVVATTVSPAIFWAIREQFRQSDAAATNESLKSEAEKLLAKARTCAGEEADECAFKSRELQDAIFQRRVANPLVFPLIYKFKRNEFEKQAEAAAAALLK